MLNKVNVCKMFVRKPLERMNIRKGTVRMKFCRF